MDPRPERTRALLRRSLLLLLEQRPYDTLSVADIARKAGVGRSTFYAHFEHKEALLLSGADHWRQALEQSLKQPDVRFFELLLQHVQTHQAIAGALSDSAGDAAMHEQLEGLLTTYFERRAQAAWLPEALLQLHLPIFVQATGALVKTWVEQGCRPRLEQVAATGERLCKSLLERE